MFDLYHLFSVPEGHSTAPADTVLELNYPLPSTKTVVVTENIVQDGLKADSKSEVSVQIKQESVTTMNEKISVTKASPITINTALSIQSVDVKTTNNVVKVESVKKLTQNNLQAIPG